MKLPRSFHVLAFLAALACGAAAATHRSRAFADEQPFLRGDADGDGRASMADALFTLDFLLGRGPAGGCLDALDTDDDGVLGITDPVRLLGFLFAGGAPLPPPHPACGLDATHDALGCAEARACRTEPAAPAAQIDVRGQARAGLAQGEAPEIAGGPDEEDSIRLSSQESRALPRVQGGGGGSAPGAQIELGEVVSGEILGHNETDVYVFSATRGQRIAIDRVAASSANSLTWRLEDSWHRAVAESTTSLDDLGPVKLLGGDYSLTVLPDGSGTGSYSFRVVDAPERTHAVAFGDIVPGAIEPDHPGARDVYTFSAGPGDAIFLESISTVSSSIQWTLTDSLGRAVLSTRRVASAGPIHLVGGDYRLTVEAPLSSGTLATGSYEIRISRIEPGPVTPIALGQVVAGQLDVPGEVDRFSLSTAAGQLVFLDQLASSNSGGLDWEIVDSLGRTVLSRTTNLNDVGPIPLAGGDHEIRIVGEAAATGTYQFRATDASVTTTGISPGVEVAGAIDAGRPGSSNVYEWSIAPLTRVTLEVIQTSNAGGLNWKLEDSAGRAVLARTTSLVTNGPIALTGGAYRLTVLGEGAATGTYRFRVRDDGPVTYSAAGTPVAIGDEISGAIPVPGGSTSYLLNATGGERVYFDLIAGNNDLDWEVFDPAGRSMGLARANNTDSSDFGPFGLAAGPHVIQLRARTATAAPAYQLKVSIAPIVESTASVGDTISGAFAGAAGAVHRYEISLDHEQRVFLDRLIASVRLDWTLLDLAGAEVFSLRRADGVDNDEGPFHLAAGDYTLVLDPEFGYQPAYQIAIRVAQNETETVAPGALVTGSFAGKAGSTREHRFDVADGARIYVDRVTASSRLDWSLRDPAGELMFGPAAAQSADADQGPIPLAGGTYALAFDPGAGGEPTYDFRLVAVADTVAPLVFGSLTSGTLGTGGTASYSFDATEGQRILLDLATGHSSLHWSLLDELGEAVFRDVDAATASQDVGPIDLEAGRYTLVLDADLANAPAYAFTARIVAVDLGVDDFDASERVFFAGDAERKVDVSWQARNAGGGPESAGPAVDRVWISTDGIAGNAGDISLATFSRFDPVAPHADYSRTASLKIPASLLVGSYNLLLELDSDHALDEAGAIADNLASLTIQIVADLPPVEPGIIETATFPFSFVASGVGQAIDVPLERPISLASIRHVHTEAVKLELAGPRNDTQTTATLVLLSGRDEVLEVGSSNPYAGQGTGTFMVRFSRRLSPQTIALLPVRTIDGLRFRFDQASNIKTTINAVEAGGKLGVYFAGCEFAPCGPHLERTSPGAENITFVGTGASPWTTILFDEAVPGDALRFVSGPRFTATVTNSAFVVAAATSEAQLILDNGALVTLDDSRSPSTLATPSFLALSASHSLGVPPGGLAGRQILGFQWRVHASSAGLGSATSLYEPADNFAVRFLYDDGTCKGTIDVPPVELTPGDGSTFSPGSLVTISGRALAPQVGRPVSAVLVNGEPVDALDGAGRFFKSVRIEDGENLFAIEVVEPGCGNYQRLLTLRGVQDGASGLEGYSEASALLRVEYAETTFHRGSNDLIVKARARNVSQHAIRAPILLVLSNLRPATVAARASAGLTGDGEPFVLVLESGSLAPGEASPYVALPFTTPDRERVTFEARWLVPSNRPPHFETSPPPRAVAGSAYSYAARASDPDGDEIHYRLDFAPRGMTVDEVTGAVTWSPEITELGALDVSLTGEDEAGGQSTQRWTLTVGPAAANRPPYFATAPVLGAAVGGAYEYVAQAVDPDGDAIEYALLSGPAGLSLDPAGGALAWASAVPGQHAISVQASDAVGSSAVQSFVLSVGTVPSNPSAPRITTSPSTEAVAGILFVYQPVASDPDGDGLAFSLGSSPAGLTVHGTTGRIEWTPQLDQLGDSAVELIVRDGRGGETRQTFTIVVQDASTNLPPVFESVPAGFAIVGQTYEYDAGAIDAEGEAIAYSLTAAPAGMSIHAATGVVTWVPPGGSAGLQVVSTRAVDPRGGSGQQSFELQVRAGNSRPALTSAAPRTTALAGTTWQQDFDASDADGDLIRYELVSGPPTLSVEPVTGLATWRTTPADAGVHSIVIAARDCCGGAAELAFSIEVLPDTEPPVAAVGFSQSPVAVGAVVVAQVSASDNAVVVSRRMTVECPPEAPRELALDEIGRTSFSSPAAGYCIFTATVVDASGNSATAVATLQVGNPEDPLDPHPPVVTVLSPAPGQVITKVTSVVATITDATEAGRPGSGPMSWTVQVAPAGSDDFETIGAGSGLASSSVLAQLDPTLRRNGVYKLRVVGNDGVQTGGIEQEVSIAGDLKLGNYSMGFVDLVVPLGGLPIVVTRRYDSLDSTPGEFGAGWRLALAGSVEDNAVESRTGNGLVDLFATEPFHPGTRVYVTLPDGRRVGFTFQARSVGGLLAYAYHAALLPDAGVRETLEVVEPAGSFFLFGGNASQIGVPYNPSLYRLRTKEGLEYLIREGSGLERIEDANGDSIDVRADGLFSSTGTAIRFERDGEKRIVKITEPADATGGGAPGELRYSYDAASGNLESFVNLSGIETRYFYEDARFPHYLTRVDDPFGGTAVKTVLDAEGRIIAQCGPDGNPGTLEGCTSYDYDAMARNQTIFDAEGHRRDLVLDERGNVLNVRIDLEGGNVLETSFEYDANDQMTSWTLPGGRQWLYGHDERGNLLEITDPSGRSRSYAYNDCDRVESETDALGATQRFEYDGSCNLVRATSPLGHVTELRRDARGALTELIEATGDHWRFQFDSRGNPASSTNPLGLNATSTINASGELETTVDRAGRRIDFRYDSSHRLISETWVTTPSRTISYEYNAVGQLVRASDPDSSIQLDYHPTGRLASIDNAGTPGAPRVLIELEQDGNGRLTQVRDSLGGLTVYRYDAMGRLESAEQSGVGTLPKRVDFTYDIQSRLARIQRFADLQATRLAAATAFRHDASGDASRPAGILHTGPAGQPIGSFDFVRDGAGNVSSITDAEGQHLYAYDGFGALLSADHPAGGAQPDERYSYDGVGNRTSSHVSATYKLSRDTGAGGHRLVQDAQFDYEHDAEGNLTRQVNRATGAVTTFRWDYRNRLTEVSRLDAQGALLGKTSHVHDALNRRIRVSDGVTTRHILHVGDNPSVELDSQGKVLVRWLYGLELDEVYAEERGGTTRWLLADAVRTVRDAVADDGSVIAHYVYDSYGQRLAASGDADASSLGFQGRPLDPATGLLHFRAREYDPHLGRFLSEDPLEPHRYGFALQNPLSFTDPTGQSVLIEYACLASEALSFGLNFQEHIAEPVGALYENIATALETLSPPPGDGGLGGVLSGLGEYLGDVAGFPTKPSDFGDNVQKAAIQLFCANNGAAADAAKAQGKASPRPPAPFTWTGPSWTK